ncbi:hypothetical protein PtA15_15A55 [Puccinia triticina]|uniref:Uncharacterized protein n=1 Tax=Puccinia triticina TaxID=208348 RepID=A0ABY7D455_9BASI|nr:uncharacterized protein PtA15_15A55 [Puccinia triticina]WAQ91665.1 hypothetical protein PtA15_15A55 [Puccinia triticina]
MTNGANGPPDSDRLNVVEEENKHLRNEIATLKQLFQNIAVQSTPSNSPNSSPSARKSLTAKQLKDAKKANADHDLEGVGSKLLTSCYDLSRCLMKRSSATAPVPSPPSTTEREKIKGFFDLSSQPPSDSAGHRIQLKELNQIQGNAKIDNDYVQYIHATMKRWGIPRFTMDWAKHWDDRFNQIMFAQTKAQKISMDNHILMAIYWRHTTSLRQYFKRSQKGDDTLSQDQAKNTQQQGLQRKSVARQLYLQKEGVHGRFIEPFDDKFVNLEDELSEENGQPLALPKTPTWRSKKATAFIDWIELRRRSQKVFGKPKQNKSRFSAGATARMRKRPSPEIPDDNVHIPIGLPEDFYATQFLNGLSFAEKKALQVTTPIFDMIDQFDTILPQDDVNFHIHSTRARIEVVNKRSRVSPDEDSEEDKGELDPTIVKMEEDPDEEF